MNKAESGNRLSEVTSFFFVLLIMSFIPLSIDQRLSTIYIELIFEGRMFFELQLRWFSRTLFSQIDFSALLSQLKGLQNKNTELEEENRKITLKVSIQSECTRAVYFFIYKAIQ